MTPLCSSAFALLALALGGGQPPPQGPVTYSADETRIESRDHRIFLDGHVQLSRGDLLVFGDRAVIELAPRQPAAKAKGLSKGGPPAARSPGVLGSDVERFTIDGAVHVERGPRSGDGDHGLFDAAAQTLTLTGPAAARGGEPASPVPVLREGQERLAGQKIVLHQESDQVEVEQPRLVLHRSQGAPDKGPPVPVLIESRRLRIDQGKRVLGFRDEVVLHRADLTVRGPQLDARYDDQGEVEELEVRGGVVLHQGTRRATGQTAVYGARNRKIVLSGDPKLTDRGDDLRGDQIELATDTEEVRVLKAHGRLHPDAHQGEETQAKARAPAKEGAP
jgi:lipopolysaccharide export system protein LptA